MFGNTIENDVSTSGDNAVVNLRLAKLVYKLNPVWFFVGCASHRLNLALQDMMEPYQDVIDRVQKLMLKLRNLITAARLRRHTHLKAKISSLTRWSSVYEMLLPFEQLVPYINKMNDDDITDLMTGPREQKRISELQVLLRDIDSVVKKFQREDTSFGNVRAVLDEVIKLHPSTKERIGENADIILHHAFETAVENIQDGLDATSSEE